MKRLVSSGMFYQTKGKGICVDRMHQDVSIAPSQIRYHPLQFSNRHLPFNFKTKIFKFNILANGSLPLNLAYLNFK